MPQYSFVCDEDLGGCSLVFEESYEMNEISDIKQSCPLCNKRKPVHQLWGGQTVFGFDKTLGSQADRNNKEFSDDYKEFLHKKDNRYPDTHYDGKLPKKGRVLKRNEKGDLI